MGQLENLPNELLELIVGHCDYEHLKSLRATSKAFHFTDVEIFDTVRIAFLTSSLDRFDRLTRNPRIASLIRCVEFVGDILPEIDSIQQYEELINLREPWSAFSERFLQNDHSPDARQLAHKAYYALPFHALSPADVCDHFVQYNSYRFQQLGWGQKHDDLFSEAFGRLLHLSEVQNRTYSFSGGNNEQFPWRKLRKEILLGPSNWMQLHAVVADDEAQDIRMFEDPIHMRHVRCLLQGVAHRHANPEARVLESMKLSNLGGQPLSASGFPVGSHAGVPVAPSSFDRLQDLTTLQLNISYRLWRRSASGTARDDRAPQLFGELHAMLLAAPALRTLALKLYDEAEWDGATFARPREKNALGRLRMPKLEYLHDLSLTCTASEDDLLTLLRVHARTLRVLELVDVHLEPGTWQSVVAEIPDVLDLDHVYLEGLRDEQVPADMVGEGLFESGLGTSLMPVSEWHPHDQAVRKFILRGGDMPALVLDDWLDDDEINEALHDHYLSSEVHVPAR